MSIHVDIIAELQRRAVDQAVTELERKFNNINAPIGVDVKAAEIKATAEKIKREIGDIRAELKLDVDKNSFGQATRALGDVERSARNANSVVAQLGKTAFQTFRGGLAIGAPLVVDGLIQIVEQATAATQALWLLPAGAAAAAAGIGTLAIATHGFADAIKDMGDPKKWAEDLQLLSPAAQQAALQIKALVDGPLGQLKAATQDAFFAGMGDQINRLVTTYLPSIQNLTTSIATSFNTMMSGVANQLVAPETQASLQTMFANIEQTFRNLEPAVQPFVRALTDIATVGSGFLPGLATSITNAANSFATFISNARESGQLQVWIQQGIDAVKNLASAAWELIQIFYRVFGPETKAGIDSNIAGVSALKETVNSYGADLTKISDIIGLVMGDSATWATKWNEEMISMQGPLGAFRDMILDIPEAMATAWNGVKHVIDDMVTNLVTDLNHMADILPDTVNKKLFGTEHPKPFSFTPLPDAPVGDWKGYQDTAGPFGGPGKPGLGGDANAQRQRRGAAPVGPGNPPPGPLLPVPPQRPARRFEAVGQGPTRRDQIRSRPFAVPRRPVRAGAGPAITGRAVRRSDARRWLRRGERAGVLRGPAADHRASPRPGREAQAASRARARQPVDGRADQAKVERIPGRGRRCRKPRLTLVDKTKGTAKDLKQGMTELSAGLDPDLGLGKGLSGLADNLVRFAGKMAFAGTERGLQDTVDATEAATGIKGGYGLLGMRGANNLSRPVAAAGAAATRRGDAKRVDRRHQRQRGALSPTRR
jgi:hypothetical protein